MGWNPVWQVIQSKEKFISQPAVASRGLNHLDVFAVGAANKHVWHLIGPPWGGSEEDIGAPSVGVSGPPAAVAWGPKRVDCFVLGTDQKTYQNHYTGTWSGWQALSLYPGVKSLAAASWGVDRLDLFAVVPGGDLGNDIVHAWSSDGTNWNEWQTVTGLSGWILGSLGAVSWGLNRLDCFAVYPNEPVFHLWLDGGEWSHNSKPVHLLSSGPAAASWGANRLDCFGKNQGADPGVMWVSSSNGGSSWSVWVDLHAPPPGMLDGPAAVSWGPNRIDCFVCGLDQNLYHKFGP
jgi:hypothetical protein